MSSYRVLAETSKRLRSILFEAFDDDPQIRPVVPSEEAISFLNPTDAIKAGSVNKLSLWLYRVQENEFVKNAPMVRAADDDGALDFPPLALDLSYLITPLNGDPEHDLHLLGKTMQVLYDNAVVELVDVDESVNEQLKIILGRISLEELTRVWEALNEPYRLSVCYTVRVTRVEADRRARASRISDSARGYGELPEGAG